MSEGNGWRLTFLVGSVPITLVWVFLFIPVYESLAVELLLESIWLILLPIEVKLLSLSYAYFVGSHESDENTGRSDRLSGYNHSPEKR